MSLILHITQRAEWERAVASGFYHGDTLATEGFIHCSTPAQVVRVANFRFAGQPGLVLLCIQTERVEAEIRFEASEGDELFPHIYGPLNVTAVSLVLDFPPSADGTFQLPPELPSNGA